MCTHTLISVSVIVSCFTALYFAPIVLWSNSGSCSCQTFRVSTTIELLPDSNYQVSAYPVTAVDLAPGDGLQDIQIYCNTCHSPGYITMQPPLSAATWEAEVNKMNKTFGAAIPEENTQKIILYLQAHYTAETRKQ